jgi:hypothetical protein
MVHTFPPLFSIIPEKEPLGGSFFIGLTGLGHTFGVRVDGGFAPKVVAACRRRVV